MPTVGGSIYLWHRLDEHARKNLARTYLSTWREKTQASFSLDWFLAEETGNQSVSFICLWLGSCRAGKDTSMVSPVLCIHSCTPSSTSPHSREIIMWSESAPHNRSYDLTVISMLLTVILFSQNLTTYHAPTAGGAIQVPSLLTVFVSGTSGVHFPCYCCPPWFLPGLHDGDLHASQRRAGPCTSLPLRLFRASWDNGTMSLEQDFTNSLCNFSESALEARWSLPRTSFWWKYKLHEHTLDGRLDFFGKKNIFAFA